LGWDAATGEEVRWHPAGPGQRQLQNGHTEIWGSSGMGKTQFAMVLLAQLARHSGSHFGIADFKNDYSDETRFPAFGNATFIDLWDAGAPYNPLALEAESDRAIQSAVIELRGTVEEAVKSIGARLGVKQVAKLKDALTSAYADARMEGRWPTLKNLDDRLNDDLRGVIGDLTSTSLFGSGEPLGNVINNNVVFGLSKIPGNGQTTVLAAGFIFAALLLKVQNLPPIPNAIRYLVVVDEAHRVSPFTAVQTMIREGRSKGLAVILATQGPLDLPDVVAHNAQTKICFGLPDATVATKAARKLQPDDPRLAAQIRTLGKGEAFVSFAGEAPRLLRMAQAYRDGPDLGLPPL
jgi:DNA helicase HerA-like ATPase